MLKRLGTICSLLFVLGAPMARAQPVGTAGRISMGTLRRYGVNLRTFSMTAIAPDNSMIVGVDDPPFTLKHKGILRRIWVIDLEELKIKRARHFDLAVPEIQQLTFTPEGHSLLMISRRGADLFRIDLSTGQQTRIMGHTRGTPGVRLDPGVMSSYNGKVYCHGFAYDGNDVGGPNQLFEIDPAGSGASAFAPVMDLDKVQKSIKREALEVSLCPKGAFFARRVGSGETLARWTPAGGLQDIDTGVRITGYWGEGTHMVYNIRKAGGLNELVMAEATTGDRKVLASGHNTYYNPVLAKQATTLVVANADPKTHSIAVFTSQDVDGYALHPLLTRIPLSTFRLSPDGQLLAIYNPVQGLLLHKFP